MRRSWSLRSLAVGAVLLAYAAVAFVFDLGGPEIAETLGGFALLLGVFLVVEGSLTLHRAARLRDAGPRDKS